MLQQIKVYVYLVAKKNIKLLILSTLMKNNERLKRLNNEKLDEKQCVRYTNRLNVWIRMNWPLWEWWSWQVFLQGHAKHTTYPDMNCLLYLNYIKGITLWDSRLNHIMFKRLTIPTMSLLIRQPDEVMSSADYVLLSVFQIRWKVCILLPLESLMQRICRYFLSKSKY